MVNMPCHAGGQHTLPNQARHCSGFQFRKLFMHGHICMHMYIFMYLHVHVYTVTEEIVVGILLLYSWAPLYRENIVCDHITV